MIGQDGEVVVRVTDVHKSFGHLEVLKGINMEVHKGEVVVIFGRSGSGKSTLLRCVNFLEDPTSGTIEVSPGGRTATTLPRRNSTPSSYCCTIRSDIASPSRASWRFAGL